MERQSVNPAVTAGLLGAMTWGSPTVAWGAPQAATGRISLGMGALIVGAGCLAGLAVANVIRVVYERTRHDEQVEEIERWAQQFRSNSAGGASATGQTGIGSATVDATEPEEELDDDPTGALPRVTQGKTREPQSEERDSGKRAEARRPRHAAAQPSNRAQDGAATQDAQRTGRHVRVEGQPAPTSSRGSASARRAHMRAIPTVDPIDAQESRVRTTTMDDVLSMLDADAAAHPVRRRRRRASVSGTGALHVPQVTQVSPTRGPVAPESDPSASHGMHGLGERLGTRARSVATVLGERLVADPMEGVPIITRADGSVGDIGSDFFSRPLIDSSRETGRLDLGSAQPPARRRVRAHNIATLDTRAEYIAHNVAEVELGLYPERRGVEDLEAPDPWEAALAAMGETMRDTRQTSFPVVTNGPAAVGAIDSFEAPTGLIRDRGADASRTEEDSRARIDDILREELSRDEAGSTGGRAFLRVIEGGTGSVRVRREVAVGERPEGRTRGRHFAKKDVRMAKEA